LHTSKTCNIIGRKPGHSKSAATVADTKGGVEYNKDWYIQATRPLDGGG
jgi:hypothetical protein